MATRVGKLLKKVSAVTKEVALRRIGVNVLNPDSDQMLTEAFEAAVEDRGIYRMLDMVEDDTLERFYALATDAKGKEKVPKRAAAAKRIADKILDTKFITWLESLDTALLTAIATAIELKDVGKAKKEALVTMVREGVMDLGMEDLVELLDVAVLRAMCKEGGLATTEEHNKAQLVMALATGTVEAAEKKKEKKPEEKPSEKKPEIAKGVSLIDLHTHFYAAEIEKYCKEHGIKATGSKKDLIKRILASFEGDETVMKGYKKKTKKAATKRAQPDDGKKKEKAASAKKAKKEEAAPAPAPAEKKPVEAKKPEVAPAPAPAAAPEKKKKGK